MWLPCSHRKFYSTICGFPVVVSVSICVRIVSSPTLVCLHAHAHVQIHLSTLTCLDTHGHVDLLSQTHPQTLTHAHVHTHTGRLSALHAALLPDSASSSSSLVQSLLPQEAKNSAHRPSVWDPLSSTCRRAGSHASFLFWFQGHLLWTPSLAPVVHTSSSLGTLTCLITVIPQEQGFTSALLSAVSAEPGRASGRCAKCSCSMTSLEKLRLWLMKDVRLTWQHNSNSRVRPQSSLSLSSPPRLSPSLTLDCSVHSLDYFKHTCAHSHIKQRKGSSCDLPVGTFSTSPSIHLPRDLSSMKNEISHLVACGNNLCTSHRGWPMAGSQACMLNEQTELFNKQSLSVCKALGSVLMGFQK